jgi:S-methylmethionine-dependent homocysteine/selenocysteine methylase
MASNNRRHQGHLILYDIAVKKVHKDIIQTQCQNHDMTTYEANITELAEEIHKEERNKRQNS